MSKPKRIVLECALRGATPAEFVRHFRYSLWCCRYIRFTLGYAVYASHINGPWFLNDQIPHERDLGIDLVKDLTNDNWEHWFGNDLKALKTSTGTKDALATYEGRRRCHTFYLQHEAPEMWQAFCNGEWPPHTPGFEIKCP